MPTGYAKRGYRLTAKRKRMLAEGTWSPHEINANVVNFPTHPPLSFSTPSLPDQPVKETDESILSRIHERFSILEEVIAGAIAGDIRSVIISGPAGVGKSFLLEKMLKEEDPEGDNFTFVKGFVKATGLYKMLWEHRHENKILVIDDADGIFFDTTSLNMMKAVLDSGSNRTVSYLSEYEMTDEEGEIIPRSFQFDGGMLFISNLDFDALINKGHKLGPHLQAIISRSMYIDLAMKTKRDCFLRVKDMIESGQMLTSLDADQQEEVIEFIRENMNNIRELSLRTALKVGQIRKSGNPRWKAIANITCCKN